jgi:phage baseplate assembly protein W
MSKKQKYGIKYPFTSNNSDNVYLDINQTYSEYIKSQLLHLLFTQKGQRLRNPDFGTILVTFIFRPNDGDTIGDIKNEIVKQVNKYVPEVIFDDLNIYKGENDESEVMVSIKYSIKIGNKLQTTTVGIKL